MDSTTNNGMCRCCASEGTYKDVISKYSWMGDEEIYSDMLKQCFDIDLCVSSDGDNGGICEVCITQLRNAANFKKQVLNTEEQFKKHLQEKLYKSNIVKVEVHKSEDIESDNNASDDYSAPEFEVPIKEEINEVAKPKKRAAAAKPTSSSAAKKPKTEIGETSTKRGRIVIIKGKPVLIPVSSKLPFAQKTKDTSKLTKVSIKIQPESSTRGSSKTTSEADDGNKDENKQNTSKSESIKWITNVQHIIQCSNATLIRCYGKFGYACAFCQEEFMKPADLKTHALTHKNITRNSFIKKPSIVVKLDITNLKCSLCNESLHTIEKLVDHLTSIHEKEMFTEQLKCILPFKFDTEELRCVVCPAIFNTFKLLVSHMHIHYSNYTCAECNATFFSRDALTIHVRVHKSGSYTCSYCSMVFSTNSKKSVHERGVHGHNAYACGYCNEKFPYYEYKLAHVTAKHGVPAPVFNCNACEKTFVTQRSLREHVKKHHLMERRYNCTECEMRFFSLIELNSHSVKHTGARDFKCDVCNKNYATKRTLKYHKRIHADDRRFKCEQCVKSFIHRASWRSHMRSQHGQIV